MQAQTPRRSSLASRRLIALARWWQPHGHAPTTGAKLLTALGSFVGLLAVAALSRVLVGHEDAPAIAAYMGAATVLLFAAPTSPMSQPWPLIGGHLVSAAIGVSCYRFITDPLLATAGAVGLAIVAMQLLGCLHPPGGAAAMVAVVGGPAIHELGYTYVLVPVGLNAAVLLGIALLVNNAIPGRRYPAKPEVHGSSS